MSDSADHDGIRVGCRAVRPGASLPVRMTEGASGFDLHACLDAPVAISPGARALIPTGLILEIPQGFEGVVRPRSGLALRHGIGLLNSPGTIDSDYRGEVGVILVNWGAEPFEVRPGDRIAQLVFQATVRAEIAWDEIDLATQRGAGGFGSTGLSGEASGAGDVVP